MENLIIQVLMYGVLGSIVGGFVARSAYRKARGISIFEISENLVDNCNLRFRNVELVPLLGTALTVFKLRKYKYNMAKEAFWIEVAFFILTPVIFMTSPYAITALVIFAFLCTFGFVAMNEIDKLHLEDREERYNIIQKFSMGTQMKAD